MRKQALTTIASAAFLAAVVASAGAETVQHHTQAAKLGRPVSEATLRKVTEQNVYGQALPGQALATPNCVDISCPGFALIGIGF
jgi:hypothetical protein